MSPPFLLGTEQVLFIDGAVSGTWAFRMLAIYSSSDYTSALQGLMVTPSCFSLSLRLSEPEIGLGIRVDWPLLFLVDHFCSSRVPGVRGNCT